MENSTTLCLYIEMYKLTWLSTNHRMLAISFPLLVLREKLTVRHVQVVPGKRAPSRIWSSWHQSVVPVASSASHPTCLGCWQTTTPVCPRWQSWWIWTTMPTLTSTGGTLLSWRTCLTIPKTWRGSESLDECDEEAWKWIERMWNWWALYKRGFKTMKIDYLLSYHP